MSNFQPCPEPCPEVFSLRLSGEPVPLLSRPVRPLSECLNRPNGLTLSRFPTLCNRWGRTGGADKRTSTTALL